MLPHHAHCVLSRLCCNEHSLLLGSYLSRIGRIKNSFCSACGHSSQDTSHLILHCPATDSLSFYDPWSRPWGVALLLPKGLDQRSSAMPPPSEGGRVTNNNNINPTWKARVELHILFTNHQKFYSVMNVRCPLDAILVLTDLFQR